MTVSDKRREKRARKAARLAADNSSSVSPALPSAPSKLFEGDITAIWNDLVSAGKRVSATHTYFLNARKGRAADGGVYREGGVTIDGVSFKVWFAAAANEKFGKGNLGFNNILFHLC